MTNFVIFGSNRIKENAPIDYLVKTLKKKKIKFLIVVDPKKLNQQCLNNLTFKKYLKNNQIKYISQKKLNLKKISKIVTNDSIGISINATWKFGDDIIRLFKKKLFNYHNADLPTHKGAGCISWIIIRNIKKTSINIHQVNKFFDSGDILLRKEIIIPQKNLKSPLKYLAYLQKHEEFLLKRFVDISLKKKFSLKKLKGPSFYWPRLNANVDGKINWNYKPAQIISFIRAFSHPYAGSFTKISNQKIRIFDAEFQYIKNKFHPFQNGIIFRTSKNFLFVANENGIIKINRNNIVYKNKIKFLGKRFL